MCSPAVLGQLEDEDGGYVFPGAPAHPAPPSAVLPGKDVSPAGAPVCVMSPPFPCVCLAMERTKTLPPERGASLADLHGGGSHSPSMLAQGKPTKPKPKSNKKFCRGCRRWLEHSCFGAKDALCQPDKRAMDNITKLAKKQGKSEWLQSMQQNDSAIYRCLRQYQKTCPAPAVGPRKKNSSMPFMQFIEKMNTKSITDMLLKGEMMTEVAFYEFAATARGGGQTYEGMRATWLQMLQEGREGTRLQDSDGPNGALQLWVKVKKEVNFHSTAERETGYQVMTHACPARGSE